MIMLMTDDHFYVILSPTSKGLMSWQFTLLDHNFRYLAWGCMILHGTSLIEICRLVRVAPDKPGLTLLPWATQYQVDSSATTQSVPAQQLINPLSCPLLTGEIWESPRAKCLVRGKRFIVVVVV